MRICKRAMVAAMGLLVAAAGAQTDGPRQVVVRVPPKFLDRAKDEVALAQLLNVDVENSQVGRGILDYPTRIQILRLMDKVRKELAAEAAEAAIEPGR